MTVEAVRTGFWKARYDITVDGRPVTTFEGATWRSGGEFALAGKDYTVTGTSMGRRFELLAGAGRDRHAARLATAERVGRREWSITADGTAYRFRRASFWSPDQELVGPDGPVGAIRRRSVWTGGAVADLPGLPLPTQVFAVVVVLCMWAAQQAASSASSSGSYGG